MDPAIESIDELLPETTRAFLLVRNGAPISEVAPLFGSRKVAMEFYVKTLEALHAPNSVTEKCVVCSKAGREMIGRFEWRAPFSRFSPIHLLTLIVGHISLPIRSDYVECVTHHAFCNRCWRSTVKHKLLGRASEFLSFACLLFGLFLAALGLLGASYLTHLKPAERNGFVMTGLGGLVLIGLSVFFGLSGKKLCVPAALRKVASRPFLLHSTSRVKTSA